MKKLLFLLILLIRLTSCSNKYEDSYQIEDKGLKYDDGTHSAAVEYFNPNTGFSNTYELNVVIENGQIVRINFPNGGYLDECHIDATDIDVNGKATIIDDEGREFEVEIDN